MFEEFSQIIENQERIKKQIEQNSKTEKHEKWYTNDELMQFLKVSRRTLANWRNQGLIGFSQIGSKIYYSQSDLEEFMHNHYCKPFSNG